MGNSVFTDFNTLLQLQYNAIQRLVFICNWLQSFIVIIVVVFTLWPLSSLVSFILGVILRILLYYRIKYNETPNHRPSYGRRGLFFGVSYPWALRDWTSSRIAGIEFVIGWTVFTVGSVGIFLSEWVYLIVAAPLAISGGIIFYLFAAIDIRTMISSFFSTPIVLYSNILWEGRLFKENGYHFRCVNVTNLHVKCKLIGSDKTSKKKDVIQVEMVIEKSDIMIRAPHIDGYYYIPTCDFLQKRHICFC